MTHLLKGDAFENRYRINGTLTTISPLHIGTGNTRDAPLTGGETVQISTIITDHLGKPLIPGSTLRGVLRNWLLTVLEGVDGTWAAERDYGAQGLLDLPQVEQVKRAKNTFSHLERLFGTPLNAGKVEVWDARCTTGALAAPTDKLLGWNPDSLTYVDTSVAIDAARGTAKDRLLYKADIVPPGVTFELNLVAQNLSAIELGLVLLGLEGFNSQIYPVDVGARGGRGYGRLKFELRDVYRLDQAGVKAWLKATLGAAPGAATTPAGYFGLPKLTEVERQTHVKTVKDALIAAIGG